VWTADSDYQRRVKVSPFTPGLIILTKEVLGRSGDTLESLGQACHHRVWWWLRWTGISILVAENSRNDADVRSGCNRRDTTPIATRRCELGFDTKVVFLFDLIGIG
jgi:hypothetical protein